MKLKSLSTALLLSIGLVTGAGSAQAVNYVEIDGASVKFLYDADFWGANSAIVTGNSISFGISSDYKVAAKVRASSATGSAEQAYADQASFGLIAVAKDGYQLSGSPNVSVAGNFSLSANGGYVIGTMGGGIYSGNFSGGVFNSNQMLEYYGGGDARFSSGAASSGSFESIKYTGTPWLTEKTLGLDVSLSAGAQQSGPGLSTSALTNATYAFTTVTAVPEPETYAMLLAGLGLVGAMARRRKVNA